MKNNFGPPKYPWGTLGTLVGTLGTLAGTLGTLVKPHFLHQRLLELPGKSVKNNFGPPKYPWGTLGTLWGTLGTLPGTLGTLMETLGTLAKPHGLHLRRLELAGIIRIPKLVLYCKKPPKREDQASVIRTATYGRGSRGPKGDLRTLSPNLLTLPVTLKLNIDKKLLLKDLFTTFISIAFFPLLVTKHHW